MPYLPEKSDLSETLNSDGFSSFAPSSVYSLNFTATAGAKINYCSPTSSGFEYIAPKAGEYRFAVSGEKAKVYVDNKYLEDIDIVKFDFSDKISYPENVFGTLIGNGDGKDPVVEDGIEIEPGIPETFHWSVVDDADAKTGIYNEKNLIKNPGFEEIESMKSGFLHPSDENYDPTAESQYYPSYWTADDGDKGFSTGNSRVNVRSNYMNSMKNFEGDGVAMWHAYGVENFYQILDPST